MGASRAPFARLATGLAAVVLFAAPIAGDAAAPGQPAWSATALRQLRDTIDAAGDEGLRPQDYRRDAVERFVHDGTTGPDVDAQAEAAARALAHDFAYGRVPERKRVDWHIDNTTALATIETDLDAAVRGEHVDDYLKGLLPQDSRYRALRQALHDAAASDKARLASIRASMERWRWMPRALGADYVYVNVPAYRVVLFTDDKPVAEHVAVVGAPKTPTPMLSANVGAIVVNPWWTLPPTVLAEGKRYSARKGFVHQTIAGKTYIRQKPGPMNALGRMKIDMPNPWAIYLHDTPSKAAFAKDDRALSHGCIRVQGIDALAEQIGDPAAIQTALGNTSTQTLQLQRSLPVYIVYFTAAPDADGQVQLLPDPYGRDAGVIAALDAPTPPIVEAPAVPPPPPVLSPGMADAKSL